MIAAQSSNQPYCMHLRIALIGFNYTSCHHRCLSIIKIHTLLVNISPSKHSRLTATAQLISSSYYIWRGRRGLSIICLNETVASSAVLLPRRELTHIVRRYSCCCESEASQISSRNGAYLASRTESSLPEQLQNAVLVLNDDRKALQ